MPDPVMALCRMLGALSNPDGSVNLPGIAEKIRPLTAEEKKSISSLPTDDASASFPLAARRALVESR